MRQRVTIFQHLDADDRNDFTPIVGAVDIAGAVTDPTFATDGAHARPWMKFLSNLAESSVNPKTGGSVMGQATVDVVDPQDPAFLDDQSRRLFTAMLADAVTGDTQLVDRRILCEQDDDDTGDWYTLIDGVITKVQQVSDTTFRLPVRDIRERERGRRVFTKAFTAGVFPFVGPADGWGDVVTYDLTDPIGNQREHGVAVNFPNVGVPGHFVLYFAAGGITYGQFVPDQSAALRGYVEAYRDVWEQFGEPARTSELVGGTVILLRYEKAIVEWQPEPAAGARPDPAAWQPMPPMPIGNDFLNQATGGDYNLFAFGIDPARKGDSAETLLSVTMTAHDAADLPAHLQRIVVRMRSNMAPTSDVPLYLRGTMGAIGRECYDGKYSDPGNEPRTRYSEPHMVAWAKNTPYVYGIIEQPEDNLFEFANTNLFLASGYLAIINAEGLLAPIPDELPDETVPLLELTDANTIDADWEHGPDFMVNRVVVTFTRELVPGFFSYDRTPTEEEVEFPVETIRSSAIHGPKELVLDSVFFRAILPELYGFAPANYSSEAGAQLGRARAHKLIDRLAEGAQAMVAKALSTDPAVKAAREGDWCIVGMSWLPDYTNKRRGIHRLAQIVGVKRDGDRVRTLRLLDAGPHRQPVALPTVNNLIVNADGTVTATVAAIPEGEVELAVASVAPGNGVPPKESGVWRTVARVAAVGDVTLTDFVGGRDGYLRWRGVETGQRPSLWTVSGPLAIPEIPTMADVRLTIDSDGHPRVEWEPRPGTGGVRISYSRHEADEAPAIAPFQATSDVDASMRVAVLPIVLHQFERVTVRVSAYPGFAAGAVTGALGAQSALFTAQRLDDVRTQPIVKESVSRTPSAATLRLTIDDPAIVLRKVEFRTRLGDDEGSWSAWVEDNAAPYETAVTLVAGQASAIEYRVTALDPLGFDTIIAQAVRDFMLTGAGTTPMMLCVATIDGPGSTGTYVRYVVDALAPDGTRGTVTLVALSGTTVKSGPSVGVPTADAGSGVAWELWRPAGNAIAGAEWDASKSGFTSDRDPQLIPGVDIDTFPLQLAVKPYAQDADTVTVEVSVSDPLGASYTATIDIDSEGVASIDWPGGSGVSGSFLLGTGATALVVIHRAAYQNGIGRVYVTASTGTRLPDNDVVDVVSKDAISTLGCRLEFVGLSADFFIATYTLRIIDGNPRAASNYAVYSSAAVVEGPGTGGSVSTPSNGTAPSGTLTTSYDTSTCTITVQLDRGTSGDTRTRFILTVRAIDGKRLEAQTAVEWQGFGL